jgi:hypothetical protein
VPRRNGDDNVVASEISPVFAVNGFLRILLFHKINEPEGAASILFPRKADVRNFPIS